LFLFYFSVKVYFSFVVWRWQYFKCNDDKLLLFELDFCFGLALAFAWFGLSLAMLILLLALLHVK